MRRREPIIDGFETGLQDNEVDKHSAATQRRILCVDDDATMLDLLQRFLEYSGYRALTQADPRVAIALAASETVDAVVIDYLMPELDGAYVAGEIRRLRPQLPIVMFSGSCPPDSRRINDLVESFVHKSEGVPALLAALQKVLGAVPTFRVVRRFPRYRVRVPLVLTLERPQQTAVMRGISTTIGEGGLGCRLNGSLKPGDFVWIDLCEPKPLAPLPGATVRYRNGNEYGFEFQHINTAQQLEIRRYCEHLAYV
jgi:CheY-like chemotaxis protein